MGIFLLKGSWITHVLECYGEDSAQAEIQEYHHNIVAYTLAWLFHLTDLRIDLERIWQKQAVGELIPDVLESMSRIVNEHIRDTQQNVTEYCKREECWDKLKARDFALPGSIRAEYISGIGYGKYNPTILSENEVVGFCKNKGSKGWFELFKWLKERNFLTPKARSQCFNMGKFLQKEKEPSVALSTLCKKAWKEAEMRGWYYSHE